MVKLFKGRLVVPKEEGRKGWHSRGYFPHFDGERATQHVCFGLFDSLPKRMPQLWREELKQLEKKEGDVELRKRIQDFLDSGHGSCPLRDDRLAEIVQNAVLHFEGQRYALHAWCVMPNHVHTLFTPEAGFSMSAITHSWKSFTANQCNKLLGAQAAFGRRSPLIGTYATSGTITTRLRILKTIRSKRACVRGLKIGAGAAPGGVSKLSSMIAWVAWVAWVRTLPACAFRQGVAIMNGCCAQSARWKRAYPG